LTGTELGTRKARLLYEVGRWRHMGNYLGMCFFVPWSNQQVCEAVEAVTGWSVDLERLNAVVERGMALARIFNLREGFSRNDDTLPRRFFGSPAEGPLKDISVDPDKLDIAQRAYFQMLGWDESGVPTYKKLGELDIEWADKYITR
jgi:aldehyde:ferredoxin oxidoreductase